MLSTLVVGKYSDITCRYHLTIGIAPWLIFPLMKDFKNRFVRIIRNRQRIYREIDIERSLVRCFTCTPLRQKVRHPSANDQTPQRHHQLLIGALFDVLQLALEKGRNLRKLTLLVPLEEIREAIVHHIHLVKSDEVEIQLAEDNLLPNDGKRKIAAALNEFAEIKWRIPTGENCFQHSPVDRVDFHS